MCRAVAGFNRKAFPWFTPKEPAKAPTVSAEARSKKSWVSAGACLNLDEGSRSSNGIQAKAADFDCKALGGGLRGKLKGKSD